MKAFAKRLEEQVEDLKKIIDTPAKELYKEVTKETNIDRHKAFIAQQNQIIGFLGDYLENEFDIPKFKSNKEKNEWYRKQLLVNKYDYVEKPLN